MDELICVVLIALVLPVAAIILAALANATARRVERELAALRESLGRSASAGSGARGPAPGAAPFSAPVEPTEAPDTPESGAPFAPPPAADDESPSMLVPTRPARAPARVDVTMPHATSEPPGPRPISAAGAEAFFTARIAVWLGAAALFMAAAFFVKWTFDAGLLGPKVRCVLGAIFGLGLCGVGEWIRRRDARVAQGCCAAGVATLYAVTLAATNLYHFFNATTGFVLLAAITAAAVILALRHGPLVALLGLVGGFVTPALIDTPEPRPGPLFAYLFLLQLGLGAVAWRRAWQPLGLLSLGAALIWVGIWCVRGFEPGDRVWFGPFIILSLGVFVASTSRLRERRREDWVLLQSIAAGLLTLIALAAVVRAGDYAAMDWAFLAVLALGAIVLGRLDARYELLPWLAAAAVAALLASWRHDAATVAGTAYSWVTLTFGALFGVGGYAAMWRAARPWGWAMLSVLSVLGAVLLAFVALPGPPAGVRWGWICLGLTVIYGLSAAPLIAGPARVRHGEATLATLIFGATALLTLAVPIEFERKLVGVAWAFEVPALGLIYLWLRVHALGPGSVVLAALSIASLIAPDVLNLPLGETRVFNWLLYAYGAPLLALVAGAVVFHRGDLAIVSRCHQAGAVLLALLLVNAQISQWHHPALPLRAYVQRSLAELGCHVSAWLALALAAAALARGAAQPVLSVAARGLLSLGGVVGVVVLLLISNPLWSPESVGATRIWNQLLLVYGLPALLMAVLARVLSRWQPPGFAIGSGVAALAFVFALVSLQVRQWFHGDRLDGPSAGLAESYAYSAAWVALGLSLLGLGVASRSLTLRWGSLVVMLLTVGKVFLVDTANLRDLYRVAFLLGLGLSLMVLAFVYQRYVFGQRPAQPKPEKTAADAGPPAADA